MNGSVNVDELAQCFLAAVTSFDFAALRACLAPDARFWVNIGPTEYTLEDRLAVLELERRSVREHRAQDVRVTLTDTGFVAQLESEGVTTLDERVRVAVCLVATVGDGLITRVEEYADSAAAAPLLRAIFGNAP